MAVKKNGAKRKLANAVRAKTARLRPVEAPAPSASEQVLRADTGSLRVPEDLMAVADTDLTDRLPSVMLVITVVSVIFISIIAWLVAQMPAK